MTRAWINWGGLAVVALAAAVLSFASLRHLAIVCGTPTGLAWLLPVCIDAAAVVATRLWLSGETPAEARRFARALALAMIVLSVAGNGADHALAAYGILPPWWAVVAVASVPPAVLGAVAHLSALVTGRPADAVPEVPAAVPAPVEVPVPEPVAEVPPTVAAPEPVPAPEPARTGRDQGPRRPRPVPAGHTDAELMTRLRALADELGGPPSVGRTRTALGVGTGRAQRLLAALNEPVRLVSTGTDGGAR
ncbi:DUF2637 domain-containing protein [Amycolatopsis sp. NPDC006131]|uniref:DUF2637 domain-containing protein n=1 Tax=Amycolatopsis sp. NPDC006131 TaxID=3156731 RepID=UPI00339F9E27